MASQNYIWAVDNCGHVHTLSTSSQLWQQRSHASDGHLVEFKKVTASRHCAWALGCDQELYVYVYVSDVPIRCLEYTYENQRWNPVHGFSQKGLFPTDREGWTDEKGVRPLPKPHDIQLPSSHWVWEYEWHMDESIRGKRTGKGGWQYAVNFNSRENFTLEKHWNSCVRRRKWIRYRKFKATGVWAVVPSLFPDALEEPFHDIAIGGGELPGQPEGYLSVWTITALGKVYCRTGVNRKCPEGMDWQEIPTPENKGLVQISVGPSGVVWGVTWDGLGIVRTGVSRDDPLGTGWQYVGPPEEAGLGQVAVGFNAVWAISRDNKIWFRQGFEAVRALVDNEACVGTSWVEMVGKMAAISVGPNDQIWALGFVDRQIYFRSGVTYEELSGRSWKLIDVHERKRSSSGGSYDASSLYGSMTSLSLGSDSSSWQGKESPTYMDSEELQRTARCFTMPALALGARPLKTGSETISRNAAGKVVRTIAIQADMVKAAETANAEDDEAKVELHPMLVRAKWTSSAREEDEDSSVQQVTQSNLEINTAAGLSRRNSRGMLVADNCSRVVDIGEIKLLKMVRNTASDPSLSSSAEDSGFASEPTKACPVPSTNGLTLTEVQDEYENRERSRQDSYSSDYSDTVINFVGNLDELESPEGLDTETDKATQTEVITEKSLAKEGLVYEHSHTKSKENLHNAAHLVRRNAYRSRSETCPIPMPVITIDNTEHSNETGPATLLDKHIQNIGLEQNGVPRMDRLSSVVSSEEHLTVSGMDTYRDSSLSDLMSSGDGGCLLWVSVSGGGCTIDPMGLPKWFEQTVISNASLKHRLMDGSWRWQILALLKDRRERETDDFNNIPLAVEKTSWTKVGRMEWYSEGKRRQWIDCTVELQKGVDGKGLEESTFTCHYNQYGKIKQILFLLSEITCVLEVNNFDRPAFAIYTAKRVLERRPVKLRVGNDKELQEWVSALSLACCESRGITGPPSPTAAWCITCRGDIFVYDTLPNMDTAPSSLMFWRQIGGHMAMIEACPAGVVWGLGMDNTPWVYTGGYGGGIFKGVYSGIGTQTDHKHVCIYENQRWNPLLGFTDRAFPINETGWTDEAGKMECSKEAVNPPTRHWQWITEWRVDFTLRGSTDNEGWQYAKDHKSRKGYHKDKKWNDYARRRRWIRKCQLLTTGPWCEMSSIHVALVDVSMQPDVDEDWDGPIALWAIGSNGDVLTRLGITRHCPEGYSWLHVPTDQPFRSISVGGNYRVWAIAKDGSAFFRNGIHTRSPTGDTWFHIALPAIAPLIQISCGASSVLAIDSQMNLWYRENITPTFPEGTRWILVSNKVRKLSVGPQDQVWILADEVNGSKGVICRREGISLKRPTGTCWDKGAGGGIMYLSVRGCAKERLSELKMADIARATVQGQAETRDDIVQPYTSSKGNVLC